MVKPEQLEFLSENIFENGHVTNDQWRDKQLPVNYVFSGQSCNTK